MSIDFENMEPGTLLLHKDFGVIEFMLLVSTGRFFDIENRNFRTANVQCVVPPKPEIHGWEAVEFREPEKGETIATYDGKRSMELRFREDINPRQAFGSRRWILKRKTEQVEETITKPFLEKPMKEQSSFKSKLKSLLWWSVAPPALLAKHAFFKSNWIGWACMAAGVSWYAWLASTGQVEVPTLQSPFKW